MLAQLAGLNVNRLFHDVIHAVMEVVALPPDRVGKLQAMVAATSSSATRVAGKVWTWESLASLAWG